MSILGVAGYLGRAAFFVNRSPFSERTAVLQLLPQQNRIIRAGITDIVR